MREAFWAEFWAGLRFSPARPTLPPKSPHRGLVAWPSSSSAPRTAARPRSESAPLHSPPPPAGPPSPPERIQRRG